MKKKDTKRMTVYHLVGLPKLKSAIKDGRGIEIVPFDVDGDRPALCAQFQTERRPPSWGDAFKSITKHELDAYNTSAGGLIVIQDKSEPSISAWALSFGQGFHYIDQYYLDQRYGIRLAARIANPDELVSLSKVTLDDRPRIERNSIPSGDSLGGFGFRSTGDFATRIAGTVDLSKLGEGCETVKLQGSDAISVPLPTSPRKLVKLLCSIEDSVEADINDVELKALEQLANVPSGQTRDMLFKKLSEAIENPSVNRITVAWPHEMNDEYGRANSYRITGGKCKDGLPEIDDLLAPLKGADVGALQKLLKQKTVTLFEDAEGQVASPKIPIGRWLSFETDDHGRRYFFQNGQWYYLQEDYFSLIHDRVAEIFRRDPGIGELPDWESGQDECEYNKLLADTLHGICLDRQLIKGSYYRNSIEACDVLLPRGVFIHVKNVNSSAPASHLLSQAFVATEAARTDATFREAIIEKIKQLDHDEGDYDAIPRKIIIVMAKEGRTLSSDSLFTFTQINLVRFVNEIESSGVAKVYVVPILKR